MRKVNVNNKLLKRIGLHILFWVLYFLVSLFVYGTLLKSNYIFVLKQCFSLLPYMLISVYFTLYIFIPHFLNKKRIFLFIIFLIIVIIILGLVRRFYVLSRFQSLYALSEKPKFFNIGIIIFWLEMFLFTSIASIIKIMKQWYFTEHKKIVLEKQNLKNELEILQYQINPHFLFNVLNNLYSLAIENDDQAIADGISKLSCLMRYNIYTSKNDKVFLKNEVEYINNYIKLQEIRFTGNYKLKVYFTINGNIESKLISPFIFIMFVENAFKYGISLNNKSIIKIELDVFDNYIEFKVSNFKNKSGNRIDSGIGLDNVKRRLEHYYPTKHLLTINDSSTDFNIYLRINC